MKKLAMIKVLVLETILFLYVPVYATTVDTDEFENAYHDHKYIIDEDMYQDENGKNKIIPDLDYIIGEEDYNEIYPSKKREYEYNSNNNSGASSGASTDYNNPVVDSVTYSKGYMARDIETNYIIIRSTR